MFFILSLIFLAISAGFLIYMANVYAEPVVYVFQYAFRSFFLDMDAENFPAGPPIEIWQIICLAVSGILLIVGICIYLYWFSYNGFNPFPKIHFIISVAGVCAVTLPSFIYNFITERMADRTEVVLFYEKYSGIAKIIAIIGAVILLANLFFMIIKTKNIYPVFVFPFHILFGVLISLLILAILYIALMFIAIAVVALIAAGLSAKKKRKIVEKNGRFYEVADDGTLHEIEKRSW